MKTLIIVLTTLATNAAFAQNPQSDLYIPDANENSPYQLLNGWNEQPLVKGLGDDIGDEPIEDEKEKTKFETIKEWFEAGTPLNFETFKGYYAGRCFHLESPNKPQPAMLGYVERQGEAGPGFPDEAMETKVMGLAYVGGKPDYFDSEANAGKNVDQMKKTALEHWKRVSAYENSPTLSYTFDWEPNKRPDEKHEFVTYENYVVQRWTALIAQKYSSGYRKPGDVLAMCYYFKRLAD